MQGHWKPFSEFRKAPEEDVAPGGINASPTPSKSYLRLEQQTEKKDFRTLLGDSGRLGRRQVCVLWTVGCLLVTVHISLIPIIFFTSMSWGMDMDPKNIGKETGAEIGFKFGLAVTRTLLLLALNFVSALFTTWGCTHLLKICMTRRWVPYPREVSPTEVNLDEFGPELEVGSGYKENSKLVEVGHLHQQQENSRTDVESRHQNDFNLDIEPLLLEVKSRGANPNKIPNLRPL